MPSGSTSVPEFSELTPVPDYGGRFFLGPRHTYWWSDVAEDGQLQPPRPLSGITSVLKAIGGSKTDSLLGWAAKCAVEFIRKAPALTDEVFKQATTAHLRTRDGAADLGKIEHEKLEKYIKECIQYNGGYPMQVDLDDADLKRVAEFCNWAMAAKVQFIHSEIPLADPVLAIAGTPDFIAIKSDVEGGGLLIGDLKTGKGIYDRVYFAQMAAYQRMYTQYPPSNGHYVAGTPSLVIIHCPASKPEQPLKEYWSHDVDSDWKAFESALYLHRWLDGFKP